MPPRKKWDKMSAAERKRQSASNAEAMSAMWLARGNDYNARGRKAFAEQCYDKAQAWLDKANKLRGYA